MRDRDGCIFNIQRASLDDGPGVRTVIFLKGCPLRCPWCHNPESQNTRPELLARVDKCVKCGACRTACLAHAIENALVDRKRCKECGKCAAVCKHNALELIGRRYTVGEAVEEALLDKAFFDVTGGGVTLSGGEPLAQPEFSLGLLKALAREGVNTCVETCGVCVDGVIKALSPYTDHWLYDVKLTDSEMHQALLGAPLSTVVKGLYALKEAGAHVTLRCLIIPGINDNDEHFKAIRTLARSVGAAAVDILPYHRLGRDKYLQLGKEAPRDIMTPCANTVALWEKAAAPEKE